MVGGSGAATVMFLLALLSAIISPTECYGSYYRLVPRVQFFIDKKPYATIDGGYTSFGSSRDLLEKLLILNEDPSFGCRGNDANETTILSYSANSVFLLPDSSSPCSVHEKANYAYEVHRASGLIFYRTSMSDVVLNASAAATSEVRTAASRRDRRRQTQSSNVPTVVRLVLLSEQLLEFRSKLRTGSTLQVTIEAEIEQSGFRTTQTFYFVVFAFCILMMLSCSWLLLSYFKRCHYRWRLRRNQARTANETRQMVNRLPTKSYKSSKEKGEVPTCVVCLEAFKNNESIRILPCKHEFHKKCIDPWLKIKRNCPMCKQDVFPSKRRHQSSSSSRSNRNSEVGRRRAARAGGTSQEMVAVLTLSNDRQRNDSWSSNTSSSSSDSDVNSSTTSSNTASNTTQETNASSTSLLHESRDTGENDVDFGVAMVITVSPAVFEDEGQQQQQEVGDGEMVVLEVETSNPVGSSSSGQDESDRPEQEHERNQEPRVSSPQHVQVDIEGVNLQESAPVIIA